MTSEDTIRLANVGGIASPDLDLVELLRGKVLPEFLLDIRTPAWRRKAHTITLEVGTRRYDLPNDCDAVAVIYADMAGQPLAYIGEDERKILAAETATAGTPCGYYVETPGAGARHGLVLDCPPDAAGTLYAMYSRAAWMEEDGPQVDLDQVMPRRFQWALVDGLKREIYLERFGQGDPKYQTAAQEFEKWKARAAMTREMGPVGDAVKSIR